jgi:hypothetical protein
LRARPFAPFDEPRTGFETVVAGFLRANGSGLFVVRNDSVSNHERID